MTTAINVAKYIIKVFQEVGDPVTNLKLQKLLYYVQGWHLGLYGEPMFEEEFQAWIHGPVVPGIFHTFKDNRWHPIVEEMPESDLPLDIKCHIDDVLAAYGGDTGWSLEKRTHGEAPWLMARGQLSQDAPSTEVISKGSMQSFFADSVNNEQNN